MDEPGVIYFLVVDPTQIGGADPLPTASEIINNTYAIAGASVWQDSVMVVKEDEYHYNVFFDSNVFGPESTDFGVYMVARDNSVPSNVQADIDIIYLQNTYGPALPDEVNVVSNPNGELEEICIGDPQVLLTPLQLIEGSDADNAPGINLKMSLIISGNFIFNVNAIADTVIGYGNMIIQDYTFGNDGLLDITYDIVGTDQRDKMVISGLEMLSTGAVGDVGTLQRFGGSAFPTIPDYTVLAEMTTTQIAPIDFSTSLGTFTVGNNVAKFALIPDPSNPLVDLGINIFSATTGAGLEGDTVFTTSAQLGTHTLTMTHTDEIGCIAELNKDYFLFDSNNAIGDLSQLYCTDEPDAVIRLAARLPDFLLVYLIVEPDNPNFALSDVTSSLTVDGGGDYVFSPVQFNDSVYYQLFTNNQGGLIGELKFTGIYQNQQDLTVFTTLEQFVEIYIPPTNTMSINGADVDGNLNTQNRIELCDLDNIITLIGTPAPATGISEGFFAINVPNSLDFNKDTTIVAGLSDNKQGTATIDPDILAGVIGFGEFDVKYIFHNLLNGCNDTIQQRLRINPQPIANYSLGTLCEDTNLTFLNLTMYNALTSQDSAQGATLPEIRKWEWAFNDENSIAGNEDIIIDLDNGDTFIEASHEFIDPGLYKAELTVTSEFGCTDSFGELSGEEIVIGGLPEMDFGFSGSDVADNLSFTSSSTVFRNATLQHSVDSLYWNFGDMNTTKTGNNAPIIDEITTVFNTYNNSGIYDVQLIAESTVGCQDTLVKQIVVLPKEIILADGSYDQYFESDDGNWIATPELASVTNSWEWGNESIGNSSRNAWITKINSIYEQDERSYLYSPSLDISNLTRPMISFEQFRELSSSDGVILEVSVDNENVMAPGKIWEPVGEIGTGEFWFNESGLAAEPGGSLNSNNIGWTDSSLVWLASKHTLSEYSSETNLIFRFGLASTPTSTTAGLGFALDSVRIGNRTRTVLLEHFENVETDSDGPLDFINDEFIASGTELVRIQYRMGYPGPDPLNSANTSAPATRALYYGVTEIPDARLDGMADPGGDTDFEEWGQNAFDLRSLNISQIDLTLNVQSINGKLEATLDAVSPSGDINSSVTVHIAVVENTADGYILRKMLPNAAGTLVESGLEAAVIQTFTETWGITNVLEDNFDQVAVVAFVQDNATKQVYQSIIASPTNTVDLVLSTLDDLAANKVALYPNPATSHATLLLESVMSDEVEIKVFDPFGRLVHEALIPAGVDRHIFNVKPLPKGIYLIQLRQNDIPILLKKMAIVHK